MQIIHKSRRNNANADGLSRLIYPPSPEVEVEEPENCSVGYEVSFCYANDPSDIKVQWVDPVPAEQNSDMQTGCPNLLRRQQNVRISRLFIRIRLQVRYLMMQNKLGLL